MSGAALATVGLFVWLVGLCVGSFLNVVIYRLPRGLSVGKPARSFCPRCEKPIAAADNLPVLSWLLLRGRGRCCGQPISVQYPLVEALTGALFLLVFYLLFVADSRVGLAQPTLPRDAPLLIAWLVLVAVMIACSAMDLVSYMVDTRVTNFAIFVGVILHACWPRGEFVAPRVAGGSGLVALAIGLATLAWLWWTVWRPPDTDDDEPPPDQPEQTSATLADRRVGVVAVIALVAVAGWLLFNTLRAPTSGQLGNVLVVPVGMLLTFLTVVFVGGQSREADEEIAAELEEEQPLARKTSLAELVWLMPLILVGVAAGLCYQLEPVRSLWQAAMAWTPAAQWQPLAGLTFALHGALVGAAAGWLLRILFTLVFGREAFGVGDIYILAAAGATAGWDIAIIGLILSVGLALAGWMLGMLLKSTMMIPFGPWLALGFVVALWFNDLAAEIAGRYAETIRIAYEQQPGTLIVGGGVMLVGAIAAVILAKLVRRVVEPESS